MKKDKTSILWNILGTIMFINILGPIGSLISNINDITPLFDLIINIFACVLLFTKHFIGVIIITFAVIVGLINFENGYVAIFQIIILMLAFPLWVKQFAKK